MRESLPRIIHVSRTEGLIVCLHKTRLFGFFNVVEVSVMFPRNTTPGRDQLLKDETDLNNYQYQQLQHHTSVTFALTVLQFLDET